ncbi:MAG TPA: hypothetical protein VNT20_00515 [Flavisolibacter sp.]|jgi:hypothetical protein|nr:hypothetical protein [Flavisolibacter sp.]
MKRLLLTLTIALSFISFSSFANNTEEVSPSAIKSFNSSFKNATEVYWTINQNYYKVNFALNGQYVSAFYDADGKMIALTRNISSLQLPIALQADLKKSYDAYWISDVMETATEDGTSYYITLETADTQVILKSSGDSWSTFKKQRKS